MKKLNVLLNYKANNQHLRAEGFAFSPKWWWGAAVVCPHVQTHVALVPLGGTFFQGLLRLGSRGGSPGLEHTASWGLGDPPLGRLRRPAAWPSRSRGPAPVPTAGAAQDGHRPSLPGS